MLKNIVITIYLIIGRGPWMMRSSIDLVTPHGHRIVVVVLPPRIHIAPPVPELSFCFVSFRSVSFRLAPPFCFWSRLVSSGMVSSGMVSSHVQPLRLPQVRQDVDQLGQWNVLRKPRGSPRCVPWCAPPPPRIKEDVNDGVDVDRDGRPERGCRRGCRRRRRSSAAAIAMDIGETAPLPPGLLPPEESIVDKGLLQRRRCRRWFCRCLCHRPCLDGFCGERSGVDVNRLGLSGRRIGLIFLFAR